MHGGSVAPGDVVGVEEEFLPGQGIYLDGARGLLRAKHLGRVRVDAGGKVVYLKPLRLPQVPLRGSIVMGIISQLRSDLAFIDILGLVEVSHGLRWKAELSGTLSGGLSISQVSDDYVRSMEDAFNLGDVVLAKTLNSMNPYHLTTKPPYCGVVYARCSRCGSLMRPASQRSMKCGLCGKVEPRKVSIAAGSERLANRVARLIMLPKY